MPLIVMLPLSGKELPAIVRRNRRSAAKPKWMKAAFGAKRVRGIRGGGDRGKTIVFGLFGRNGRVYAEIVPEFVQDPHSRRIIRGRVEPESVIHSDDRRGHDGLVDSGCRKHFRGEHGDNEFAGRRSCVNGLESFWTFAKRIQRCSSKCSENYLSANHDSETLHLALKLLLARRRPSMPSELTAVR